MASTKKPRRPRTAKDLGSGIFYVPGTWWGLEARSARSLRLLLDNDRLFIALAQAFIAADRLAALHSFMEWNDRYRNRRAPTNADNLITILLFMGGVLYEAAAVIKIMSAARLRDRLKSTRALASFDALEDLRKRWRNDPMLSMCRNKLAFHLGDHEALGKGLEAWCALDARLLLTQTDTGLGKDTRHPFGMTLLNAGLGLKVRDYRRLAEHVVPDYSTFAEHLQTVLFDLLKGAGVSLSDLDSLPRAKPG